MSFPGAGVDSGSACPDCLRRAWLVARLGVWIQTACDDLPGRRTPELLRLSSESLVEAVAAKKDDEILEWNTALGEGEMRAAIFNADCWCCCRHDESFPVGLRDGADAPPVLIGRGGAIRLRDLELENSVTVVGARKATGYGLEMAATLGRELAVAGLNVISGMALGIDGAVHRGSLEVGPTIAVLGCGPDRPYPASHARLYGRIVERGLVVSEVPPGAEAWRWSFPARNRIMAALAGMTVVVEAASRSGSLITAEMASDAGRDVGAVPGLATSRVAVGPNELIASGAALIRSGADVIDRMPGATVGEPLFGPEVEPGQAALLAAVEAGCRTVEEIAREAGSEVGEAARGVALLEVKGYLKSGATGTWSRTSLAPYPSERRD
ncbi:MAG: DNA-processing protein DprA [Solirubrobacterales bacterium]|nr:DNA-processing protein DprA [Solirubrobacterales bacterium]